MWTTHYEKWREQIFFRSLSRCGFGDVLDEGCPNNWCHPPEVDTGERIAWDPDERYERFKPPNNDNCIFANDGVCDDVPTQVQDGRPGKGLLLSPNAQCYVREDGVSRRSTHGSPYNTHPIGTGLAEGQFNASENPVCWQANRALYGRDVTKTEQQEDGMRRLGKVKFRVLSAPPESNTGSVSTGGGTLSGSGSMMLIRRNSAPEV